MKHFLTLSIAALLCNYLVAQDSPAGHMIKARVIGLRPADGTMLFIGLLDAEGQSMDGRRVPVEAETMDVDFGPVACGTYAIRLFVDENGNGEVDLGLFKIPKEGVGCSNNAVGFMSAPAIKDMLFEVRGPKAVGIALKYY